MQAIPCQCHVLDKLMKTERHRPLMEVFHLRAEIPGISCPQKSGTVAVCVAGPSSYNCALIQPEPFWGVRS